MAVIGVRSLGEFIREQRASSQLSLRQLATLAGVSNPYLSQIERGLRKPSAEILQQIAKGLRVSAEVLYVQAGILEEREEGGQVAAAVLADEDLTERQKQVLLEIYDSFRKENSTPAPVPLLRPVRSRAAATTRGAIGIRTPATTGPTATGAPTSRRKS